MTRDERKEKVLKLRKLNKLLRSNRQFSREFQLLLQERAANLKVDLGILN